MSAVKSLTSRLGQLLHRTTPYQNGSSLVPKLDYLEIESRLKSAELGSERGAKGLPPADTTSADEVELRIQNTYQELIDKTAHDVNEALASYNQRIISLDLTSLTDNIRDAARSTIGNFQSSVITGLNELKNASETVKEKLVDYRYFKKSHSLKRSASYPTDNGGLIRGTIIFLLFVFESIGNAAFLAKGNMGGLVGAYGEALGISFINVGIAFLIGKYISRNLYHKAVKLKLFGFVIVLLGFALAFILNLGVAHYRELSGAGLFGTAGLEAISKISHSPFGLTEIESWLLFAVGLLFWIIALIDSHTMDDNYPGYGKVDRALKDAREYYADSKTDIIERISEYRADGEKDIKLARSEVSEVYGQVSEIFNLRTAMLNDYGLFSEQSECLFKQSLEAYRNANRSLRKDSPMSFNNVLEVSIPKYGDDAVSVDMESLSLQVETGRKTLDDALDNFYKEYKEALDSFKKLDDFEAEVDIKLSDLDEAK